MLYSDLEDRLFSAQGKWNVRQCQSPDCKLLWLDPMPLEEDIGNAYLDYYTHDEGAPKSFLRKLVESAKKGYFARKYKYNIGRLNIWQKFLGLLIYLDLGLKSEIDYEVLYLKFQPQEKLLDVGCGNGSFIARMKSFGWQVEGTEVDEEAVEAARRQGLEVKFGELSSLEYSDSSFDVITLNSVIEHISNPLTLLSECKRILKEGGSLVIFTPNAKSRIHSIYKEKWFDLDPPRHLHIFSFQNLKTLVQKAGFKNIDVLPTSRNLRSTLIGSWDIKKKGRHKMGDRQPLLRRLVAKMWQFLEEIILRVKKDVGDEILLKAQKT